MKLLLTNDDGIDADGFRALIAAAAPLGELIVVAPRRALSGCSHQVTTDEPLHVERRSSSEFVIDGTPADCIRVALHDLATDIDWVLSGINHGGNLGADVYISGTVAAVREAALHGKPGVALSQYRKRNQAVNWQRSAAWSTPVLRELLVRPRQPGLFWNVNLPHLDDSFDVVPAAVDCPLEPGPLPLAYRRDGPLLHYAGNYHQRERGMGTDVDVCFGGRIAVTRLALG
jgi:5'-nucleotidase